MSTLSPRRRREDRWPFRIWAWGRRFLAVIGLMVLLSCVMTGMAVYRLAQGSHLALAEKMVLAYTIREDLAEVPGAPSLLNPRLTPVETLRDVVAALDTAAKDVRVSGLVVRLDSLSLSFAQVEELRAAILRFRAAGKFAWIYAPSYGGFGEGGMGPYYLASAFDQIWMQPVGMVSLPGVAFSVPFARDLLARLGVKAEMLHQGIYKSAIEPMTRQSLSAPARENLENVLTSLDSHLRAEIAAARGFSPEVLDTLITTAMHGAATAPSLGLVDRLGALDELVEAARAALPQGAVAEGEGLTPLLAYAQARRAERPAAARFSLSLPNKTADRAQAVQGGKAPGHRIALVVASGEIVDDRANPALTQGMVTPEAMRRAFAAVRRDESVAAIVLRLDTPGGSALASESIRRLIVRSRERGVPVVVSMGGMAASGGYWIASAADKIVAQPMTLTGSIGVFGGKFVAAEGLQKWGVDIETLKTAPAADAWSVARPFSDAERARVDALMAETYQAFVARVAEGRKMTPEQVEIVAQGRVFTGRDAQAAGLVDALGGLDVAIPLAAQIAGIDADSPIEVAEYPSPRPPFAVLMSLLTGEGVLVPLQLHIRAAFEAAVAAAAEALVMPPPPLKAQDIQAR